jgi:hypothetical protein
MDLVSKVPDLTGVPLADIPALLDGGDGPRFSSSI